MNKLKKKPADLVFQESDTKNKKTIATLKDEFKTKDRDFKKNESELNRAKEKMSSLEEKIVTMKSDFKAKEAKTQEAQDKKTQIFEEKINDLRTRLKSKDDDYNELSKSLKMEKNEKEFKCQEIESLMKIKEEQSLELQLTKNSHVQKLKELDREVQLKKEKFTEQITILNQTVCCKDVELREYHEKLELSQANGHQLNSQLKILNFELEELEANKLVLNSEIASLVSVISERDETISNLGENIEHKTKEIAVKDKNFEDAEEIIKNLENEVSRLEVELAVEKENHIKKDETIMNRDNKISELTESLNQAQDIISKQTIDIEQLNATLQSNDACIVRLEKNISDLKTKLQETLDKYNMEISDRQTEIQDWKLKISNLEKDKLNLNSTITELGKS